MLAARREGSFKVEGTGSWVLAAPRLRLAKLWLAEKLAELAERLEGVLLPYPVDMVQRVKSFIQGSMSWEELVQAAASLGLAGASSWAYVEEPLLRMLKTLNMQGVPLKIKCYGPSVKEEAELAWELLRLLINARLRGVIDLEAWREVLPSSPVPAEEGYATVTSRRVEGANVLSWDHPFPPGEELTADNLTLESVREYVDYVFRYVMLSSNVDEAYLKWLESSEGRSERVRQLRSLAESLGIVRYSP